MDITKRFDRILRLFFILQSKTVVTIDELENRFGSYLLNDLKTDSKSL